MDQPTFPPLTPYLADWPTLLKQGFPDRVKQCLKDLGAYEDKRQKVGAFLYMRMGEVLSAIQARRLYQAWDYKTWSDFMEQGFPAMTGLSARTGYNAINLSHSALMIDTPEESLQKIPLSSAIAIARLEKHDSQSLVGKDVIQMAQDLPSAEFRRELGIRNGAVVQLWVPEKTTAAYLQEIVEHLRNAEDDSLRALVALLDSPEMAGYAGGPTGMVDALVSGAGHELQNAAVAHERNGMQAPPQQPQQED